MREAKAHFGDGATEAEKAEESDRLESTSENESFQLHVQYARLGLRKVWREASPDRALRPQRSAAQLAGRTDCRVER